MEIEKRAAGQNIAGGPSNLSRGIKLFDEFMGRKACCKAQKGTRQQAKDCIQATETKDCIQTTETKDCQAYSQINIKP